MLYKRDNLTVNIYHTKNIGTFVMLYYPLSIVLNEYISSLIQKKSETLFRRD